MKDAHRLERNLEAATGDAPEHGEETNEIVQEVKIYKSRTTLSHVSILTAIYRTQNIVAAYYAHLSCHLWPADHDADHYKLSI